MNTNRFRRRVGRALLVAVSATALFSAVGTVASADPLADAQPAPVHSLDLPRYLGTWHQVAAVPAFFNLVCARDTQAQYSLDPAGTIVVHNTCTTWANTPNEITGAATVNDPVTRAQLHVSFPGVPTQEQLQGPTNYIVTALGPDYSWAVVTDPNRTSGFVLSRSASQSPEQWNAIKAAITTAGLNPCLFLTSPTTGGLQGIAPLCTL